MNRSLAWLSSWSDRRRERLQSLKNIGEMDSTVPMKTTLL